MSESFTRGGLLFVFWKGPTDAPFMASTPCSFEPKGAAATVRSATSPLLQEVHRSPRQLYAEAVIGTLATEGVGLCHSFLPALPILSCPMLSCPPQSSPPTLQATPTPFPILPLPSPFLYILPRLLHIFAGLRFVMLDDTLPYHLETQLCNPQNDV